MVCAITEALALELCGEAGLNGEATGFSGSTWQEQKTDFFLKSAPSMQSLTQGSSIDAISHSRLSFVRSTGWRVSRARGGRHLSLDGMHCWGGRYAVSRR